MKYVESILKSIASSFGIPHHLLYRQPSEEQMRQIEKRRAEYEAAQKAVRALGISFEGYKGAFRSLQEALVERLKESLTLKPGPGVSRKGLPLIGSHWIRRGTKKVFQVMRISGAGVETVIHIGNPHAPDDTALYSMCYLHSWNRLMKFKRYGIPTDHSLLYAGESRKPIKRVYWEPVIKSFYRMSANGKTMYRMSFEFNEAWKHRAEEYPRCSFVPSAGDFVVAPQTITTPKVRLTFAELFPKPPAYLSNPPSDDNLLASLDEALVGVSFTPKLGEKVTLEKSDKDRWRVCGVAGEDMKTGDVVGFGDDGTLKKAVASDEETRERADAALEKAEPTKWATTAVIDTSKMKPEDKQKLEDATKTMHFTGSPLERCDAATLAFLNRIGEFNKFGRVTGIWQSERNVMNVGYSGGLTVVFDLPYQVSFPLKGY